MKAEKPPFWFHAKRYGWGWGLPARWEGWVVLIGYFCSAIGGLFAFFDAKLQPFYIVYLVILTLLLLAICWWKGEAPQWRWDDETPGDTKTDWHPRGLLLFHLLIGPLLLSLATYFWAYPPAEINNTYGYRTEASMSSQEAWDEAQIFSSKAMAVAALITIVYQVASCVLMKPITSLVTSCLVLAFTSIICIPLTELHLQKHFDDQGQRIVYTLAVDDCMSENPKWPT